MAGSGGPGEIKIKELGAVYPVLVHVGQAGAKDNLICGELSSENNVTGVNNLLKFTIIAKIYA